jgi:hypothetical protein
MNLSGGNLPTHPPTQATDYLIVGSDGDLWLRTLHYMGGPPRHSFRGQPEDEDEEYES